MSHITTVELGCGMPLLVERMPNVASLALSWLLPAGSATDPIDGDGQAAILSELIFRGAGELSSRQLSDALDRLGVQRSSQVRTHHLRIDATILGDHLADTLPLLVSLVRSPALDAAVLDPVRSLCLQSLDALDDDPQHLAMLRLRQQHLAPPFNRHGYGERTVLESTSIESLRSAWSQRFVPAGAIFSAAGAVDPDRLADQLNQLLAGWAGRFEEPVELEPPDRSPLHIVQETAQVHIGLAYEAPPESDENSLLERLAVTVLGGSTSGRLFTEVRQKRSLSYSVGASYRAGRDEGVVTLYAGTTPDRAQETLDVCTAEVRRLTDGIDEDEFHRASTGLKSHLVMQGESTGARALALGADQFRLSRPRSLEEIAAAVDAISLDQLNAYIACRRIDAMTIVSLGPVELKTPAAATC
ncbi:MAG: insulinase family protein [Phycisphaerales bacterium]|nr:MAG: insulinase family protein [Phycisphaerales bacterium]